MKSRHLGHDAATIAAEQIKHAAVRADTEQPHDSAAPCDRACERGGPQLVRLPHIASPVARIATHNGALEGCVERVVQPAQLTNVPLPIDIPQHNVVVVIRALLGPKSAQLQFHCLLAARERRTRASVDGLAAHREAQVCVVVHGF